MSAFEQKLIESGLESVRKSQSAKDSVEAWRYCQVALMQFVQARWIDPKNWVAHYCEGEILKNLGLLSEAADRLHAVIEINPGFIPAYRSLGMVRMEQAAELFQKAA